jgi:hypothetical protein
LNKQLILPLAILAVAAVLFSCSAAALLSYTARIGGSAQIKTVGVGVYSDAAKTIPVSSIDWGMLDPGQSKTVSVYISNNGNVPLNLTMRTENWQPAAAANYISLAWNDNGSQLPAGSVRQIAFTLSVNASITGIQTFTFDSVIVGSG